MFFKKTNKNTDIHYTIIQGNNSVYVIKASIRLCKAESWEMDVAVSEGQAWQSKSKEESCSLAISNIYAGHIYGIYITLIYIWGSLYIHKMVSVSRRFVVNTVQTLSTTLEVILKVSDWSEWDLR